MHYNYAHNTNYVVWTEIWRIAWTINDSLFHGQVECVRRCVMLLSLHCLSTVVSLLYAYSWSVVLGSSFFHLSMTSTARRAGLVVWSTTIWSLGMLRHIPISLICPILAPLFWNALRTLLVDKNSIMQRLFIIIAGNCNHFKTYPR